MHIQIVNFNLKDLSDQDFREASAGLAPMFAAVPGLVSKVWLADQTSNVYGGVYIWRDKAAMDEYAASNLFNAVVTNPHFVNLTSRDFGIQDGPTRTTAGPLQQAFDVALPR